mgnify:CR=1 FL=1
MGRTAKERRKKQSGRYYDNYFIKVAARAPYPVIAVSARIPLPSGSIEFEGHPVQNTSVTFVSGLAELDRSAATKSSLRSQQKNAGQLVYVLTYGVGNAESYSTRISAQEIEQLFDAMETVVTVEESFKAMSTQVAAGKDSHSARSEVAQSSEIMQSRQKNELVLDYVWQDEGTRVRTCNHDMTYRHASFVAHHHNKRTTSLTG